MQAVGNNTFLQQMMQKPGFRERLNASKNFYKTKGIECQTQPSEECLFNKCDGQGLLHYIDWTKKLDAIDNPEKYKLRNHEIEWYTPCECLEKKKMDKAIAEKVKAAGIPEKFRKAKVHGFQTECYKQQSSRDTAIIAKTFATQFVEQYEEMEQKGKGLYFYSRTKGSGKTRLASSIANALLNKYQRNVLFIKAADISAQVRKTYHKNADMTEEEVLEVFRSVEVLVIDDLAVTDEKGYTEDLLGKILDHRMDRKLITLITSNRTLKEIDDFYKKGIVGSRVRDLCYEILMPEESVRDMEAERKNEEFERLLLGGA